jgi:hypothetical protein
VITKDLEILAAQHNKILFIVHIKCAGDAEETPGQPPPCNDLVTKSAF